MAENIRLIINREKIELMRSYEDSDFISFIGEINASDIRPILYDELKYYVPLGLKNNNDAAKKFGLRTQNEFINSFKLRTNKTIIEPGIKVETQDLAIDTLQSLFILWCKNKKIIELNIPPAKLIELADIGIIKKLSKMNKDKRITKEAILRFYKFNPYILSDAGVETYIDEMDYTDADEIGNSPAVQRTSKKELEELSEQNRILAEDKKTLLEENQSLKKMVERLEVNDVQKMKRSLETKIKNLEKQLEAQDSGITIYDTQDDSGAEGEEESFKDKYYSLKKTSDKIKDLKIAEFDKKIRTDKKYQQLIMSLILHNSAATKLLIKHLDIENTIRDVIMEARAQVSDLQQQMIDLESGKEFIKTNSLNKIQKEEENNANSIYTYDSDDFNMQSYFKTLIDNIKIIYEESSQAINIRNKIAEANFIISDDDKLPEAMDMDSYGIPYCRVAAEPGWHGIEDWFGYYNEEGIFIPSKTLISDYYKFVKDTEELPFGAIIFDNFNQIPPEIYIEPFIKNMETVGYHNLVHKSLVKDGSDFATIEKISKLKFIFIKSKDRNSFDIPESLRKYELGV